MSKKSFVIIWPFLLLLGMATAPKVVPYIFGMRHFLGNLQWSDIPNLYILFLFTGPYVSCLYTMLALFALAVSLILWFKRPCIWTLLGTIITAWGLCGIPAMYIIAMSNFRQ